ncbi:hypothetical protein GOV04_00965 [Candidatus Woesearchaeota archaeon]|nr:hypothetical protein [Candidatus Woesearchaeota archaeon]
MTKVLVFGNPYIKIDSLAIKVAKKLQKENMSSLDFVFCDNPSQILEHADKELIILDVAKGVKKVIGLRDPDRLVQDNVISLHDFDLNYFLKLLKQLDKLEKILIIAIPLEYETKKAVEETKILLEAIV